MPKTLKYFQGANNLKKKAKKIFLIEKPAPVLQSLFKGLFNLFISSVIENSLVFKMFS